MKFAQNYVDIWGVYWTWKFVLCVIVASTVVGNTNIKYWKLHRIGTKIQHERCLKRKYPKSGIHANNNVHASVFQTAPPSSYYNCNQLPLESSPSFYSGSSTGSGNARCSNFTQLTYQHQ